MEHPGPFKSSLIAATTSTTTLSLKLKEKRSENMHTSCFSPYQGWLQQNVYILYKNYDCNGKMHVILLYNESEANNQISFYIGYEKKVLEMQS